MSPALVEKLTKAKRALDDIEVRFERICEEVIGEADPLPDAYGELYDRLNEFANIFAEIHIAIEGLEPAVREWTVFLETRDGIVYRNGVDDTVTVPLDLAAALVEGRVLSIDMEDAGTSLRFHLPSRVVPVPKSLVVALAQDTHATHQEPGRGDKTTLEQGGGGC